VTLRIFLRGVATLRRRLLRSSGHPRRLPKQKPRHRCRGFAFL
jgi:hypothetical protein